MWPFKRDKRPTDTFRRGESEYIPRWSSPPKRNTQEWIKYFSQSPRLAVVERIASDLSFAAGKLYRIDEGGKEYEVSRHPFLTFWDNPNPLYEMTNAALWRLFEIYVMLKGEGYFIIERDLLGKPAELWPVPVYWVQMTPYAGFPYYTVRLATGAIMNVSVDDMFVMKDLDPFNPFDRGLGQSESLADEIETDEYAAKFQKNFFYNDAASGTIVSMPEAGASQRDRFEKEWNNDFKGVKNSHKLHILKSKVEVLKMTDNMKDMDMIQGRTFLRDAVLQHYGIPREIMGITESSNRATSDAAQFIYAQNVLMPKLRRREEAINRQLLPMFGDNLIWRFDDIVPHNQEFDKAKAIDGWNCGLLMKNEARALMDMPAVKNGDVYKTTFSDVYISAADDPASTSYDMAELQYGEEPAEGEGDQEITITKARASPDEIKSRRVKALQNGFGRVRGQQERQFERTTLKYFRQQQSRIQSVLDGSQKADKSAWDAISDMLPDYTMEGGSFIKLDAEEKARAVDNFVLGLLDWDAEAKSLENMFAPLWMDTYGKGADLAIAAYRIPSTKRPKLASFAKLRGAQRVKNINETTKDSIRRIVSAGIENGDTRDTMSKAIVEEMNTHAGRARVIAQTETHTSLMTGNMDTMQAGGVATKTWITVGDGAVRDRHKKLDGVTVPIDAKFPNGLRYPGDPECSDPAEVINCRCDIVAGDF